MVEVSEEEFQRLIDESLGELPSQQVDNIKNVAILYEDLPTEEQRTNTNLHPDQTLLGLYEGIPLTKRQGMSTTLPDKITLFRIPLQYGANTPAELKENIKHTLWHEIAHYYGLDHDRIHELE
ncbi:MAG: metallopeptidase family protein [Patescibacteria group bacterium]